MNEHPRPDAASTDHPEYEPTVLRGSWMLVAGAGLAGLILFALLVTFGLWRVLQGTTPPPVPISEFSLPIPPGEPALNPNQPAARRQYDEAQRKLLSEYAWQNENHDVARIPIERAMEIMVERAQQK